MTLLDNGVQTNTIMPGFVKSHSFEIGPLSHLVSRHVTCVGLGNALTWPMGYVIIWVQVDGVQGYDEDQIALVIPYLLNFAAKVPIILRTPMISCIVYVIKEKEIDTLAMPWVNAQVTYLLAIWWATATVENDKNAAGESDPGGYDEVVTTKDTETIDAFSSCIMHARMGMAYTGEGINVITQALHAEDGSLPKGLTVENTYTELHDGSRNITVVVRNSTAYPQTLRKKTPVARAVTVMQVPEPPMQTSIMEVVEGTQGYPMLSWLWNKVRINCSRSWIWVDWNPGHPSWWIPPGPSWLSTKMSSPRTQWTWLYSLDWTHDQSHWQHSIQGMIQI